MSKSILITGIAGSGKSTIAVELKKLGYQSFGIEDIKGIFTAIDKRTGIPIDQYDHNLESIHETDRICNIAELQKLINNNSNNSITFYAGTASNIDKILPLFNQVFLLQVDQEILRQRLSQRTPEHFAYTSDVQDRMFTRKDERETNMIQKGAIAINGSQSLGQTIQIILHNSDSGN